MTISIFCPLCQRKNSSDATHCTYCGVQFVVSSTDALTTERISKRSEEAILSSARCAEYLAKRTSDGLALFVMDVEDPIVIEDTPQIIIGRHVESSTIPVVDLTEYRGIERGVSRRHIQISCINKKHNVADLGSTNGTWLNRVRLAPGKPYELRNNDELLLGQMRILVCIPTEAAAREDQFYIRDTRSDVSMPEHFTPEYLATVVTPFLQAIIDIEKISQTYQGHTTQQKPHINEIRVLRDQSQLMVDFHGIEEAKRVIQTWVMPWKQSNADRIAPVVSEDDEAHLKNMLQGLARTILGDLAPDASAIAINDYIPKLLNPLVVLVCSQLALSTKRKAIA